MLLLDVLRACNRGDVADNFVHTLEIESLRAILKGHLGLNLLLNGFCLYKKWTMESQYECTVFVRDCDAFIHHACMAVRK